MIEREDTIQFLPDDDKTYVVETSASSYVVIPANKTAERWPAAPGASTLRHDGEPMLYTSIHCMVGERLTIQYAPTGAYPAGWQRDATQVESITVAWINGWSDQ